MPRKKSQSEKLTEQIKGKRGRKPGVFSPGSKRWHQAEAKKAGMSLQKWLLSVRDTDPTAERFIVDAPARGKDVDRRIALRARTSKDRKAKVAAKVLSNQTISEHRRAPWETAAEFKARSNVLEYRDPKSKSKKPLRKINVPARGMSSDYVAAHYSDLPDREISDFPGSKSGKGVFKRGGSEVSFQRGVKTDALVKIVERIRKDLMSQVTYAKGKGRSGWQKIGSYHETDTERISRSHGGDTSAKAAKMIEAFKSDPADLFSSSKVSFTPKRAERRQRKASDLMVNMGLGAASRAGVNALGIAHVEAQEWRGDRTNLKATENFREADTKPSPAQGGGTVSRLMGRFMENRRKVRSMAAAERKAPAISVTVGTKKRQKPQVSIPKELAHKYRVKSHIRRGSGGKIAIVKSHERGTASGNIQPKAPKVKAVKAPVIRKAKKK